jgi:hypothetical protein
MKISQAYKLNFFFVEHKFVRAWLIALIFLLTSTIRLNLVVVMMQTMTLV